MDEAKPYLWYRYTFTFDDGVRKVFEVRLDSKTQSILPIPRDKIPEWTRLDNRKCGNCPLKSAASPHCPIAVNMTELVESFGDIISYKEADVLVETHERNISRRVPVQNALYSLMGIYMSASGCPLMDRLKPLVRFHMPFATVDETIYRVTTMYVMAQYLRMQSGLVPDWELAGVKTMFEEVHKVNVDFCQRLHSAIAEDSLVNSVSTLDVFAHMAKAPSTKRMGALRQLFEPYLEVTAG